MQKNQQALAIATRRAIGKSKKIKELGITSDMSLSDQDDLVLYLSESKEPVEGKTLDDFIKGQEWYVKDLIKFSALSAQERMDYEYAHAFPEVATEDEGLEAIEACM